MKSTLSSSAFVVGWLALGLLPATAAHAEPASRAQLLAAARATLASEIEAGLPEVPVASWLRSLVGAGSRLAWGLNDCGEQTGVPEVDAARDRPVCAELEAPLPDGGSVALYFLVGSQSQGVAESRGLYFAGILGGPQDRSFPDLEALEAHLRKRHP